MSPQNLTQAANEIMAHIVIARENGTQEDYEGARAQLAQAKKILSNARGAGYSSDHPILVSCESHINFLEETLP